MRVEDISSRDQEQQVMSAQGSQDDETLRNEIQAAIKAGREVGPDMDEHLADSVLQRYREEQAARSKALTPQRPVAPPARSGMSNGEAIARAVITVAGMAVFLGIILWNPHMWGLIFVLPFLFGLWGRRHWGGYDYRRDRMRERRRDYWSDAPPIEQV
jgi:hypothetical protein